MDLAGKKLAFIEEYLNVNDERLINKLEEVLHREKGKKHQQEPLTQQQMDAMIEESEEDIKAGRVISHEKVKQEVLSWKKK